MQENILELLQQKPLFIPKILYKNYKKLNITDSELIIIIYLLNLPTKILYNPELFVKELDIDKFKIMEMLSNLEEKSLISIKVEKNKHNKTEEYISLDLLYAKLLNIVVEKKEAKIEIDNDLFTIFEQEFGRPLSPMEFEIIKEWLNSNISKELIIEALKEATYNNVSNLKYIDKILYEWKRKGLKNKNDVLKDKANYRNSQKEKIDIYDYNWLEGE